MKTTLEINNKENKHKLLGSYEDLYFTIKLIDRDNKTIEGKVYPDVSFANVNNVLQTINNIKENIELNGMDKTDAIGLFFKDQRDVVLLNKVPFPMISTIFTEIYKYLGLFNQDAILEMNDKLNKLKKEVDESKKY